MRVPCQAVQWYLLPALGASLAAELRKGGMSQREIAKRLGLSEGAISHYAKGKRGAEIKFDRKTERGIASLAKSIGAKKISEGGIIAGVCSLCTSARRAKSMCSVHRKEWKLGKCTVCFGGDHGCF